MKPGGWNRIPLWARFFGVLLGFPLIVAIVRVALARQLHDRFTADLLVAGALLILCIPLFWKRKEKDKEKKHNQTHQSQAQAPEPDEPESEPLTKEERHHENREVHKLNFGMFAIFTLVLLTGTVISFCILFSATPQSYPELLYGVFRLFGAGLGIVLLVVTFICFQGARSEFLLLKGTKPPREVSISGKAALCALAILLAIAFAIARLAHL